MDLKVISMFAGFGAGEASLLVDRAGPVVVRERPDAVLKFAEEHKLASIQLCGAFAAMPEDARMRVFCHAEATGPGLWSVTGGLDSWQGQAEAFVRANAGQGSWAISAGFLADLADPRPFLLAIKRFCLETGRPVLFLHGADEGRFRKWTSAQFGAFLDAGGFAASSENRQGTTTARVAVLSETGYRDHLTGLGFSAGLACSDLLLVTTEDASIRPTGGIGTYTSNIKAIDPKVSVLFCDIDLPVATAKDGRTFLPRMFGEQGSKECFFDGLGLLESLYCVLFLLPDLVVVEIQDYKSIGFRIVQAKRTGCLPAWLNVRIFMHGSIDYVKYGAQDEGAMNYTPYEAAQAIRDAYLFKHADECYAPSSYLGKQLLQQEFGYEPANLSITRLPFDLDLVRDTGTISYKKIKRIVFVGKYNQLKGWPDFVKAIEALGETGRLKDIEEIVSLGPLAPSKEDRVRLAKYASYKDMHLTHAQLIEFTQEHAADSLFVVPSRGENYPFVILEQLLMGTLLVAYNTGGAIEVVDDPEHVARFFSAPDAIALQRKMDEVLTVEPAGYEAALNHSRQRIRQRQRDINAWWSRKDRPTSVPAWPVLDTEAACDLSIVVPVYNTDFALLGELLQSICASRLLPKEVIIVDDGSREDYAAQLQAHAVRALGDRVPLRVHRQQNRGLAGARNAGLALSGSELTFFIDSDDVLLRNTLERAVMAMRADPSLLAATGFAIHFTDIDDLRNGAQALREGWFWKALGVPEARALALLENQYITSNVMVRTQPLRDFGGWDESDRSVWEDWAFYSRLAWSGKRFSLIPSAGYLYRNTPSSMSKTYNRYFGRRRLVRNTSGLTRLDANVLYSLVNSSDVGGTQLAGPSLSEKEVELVNFVRRMVQRPRLRRMMIAMYRFYSRVRRLI
ncbi:glycosyltransferase [Achromobacter xylosoxidans]|uniref:Glycosyltransferase n=1 Tax=Alcaligenes xylosoxydans xylosoxydans TaxID=85698 RepID=A0A424W958_ALCXX|nr:glycosyltransferase [Achromobacter xylosoxidans]MBC9906804.1 glycosyltransferase [Achromobacter xylosoxidans]MBD0870532.1 glycosyltransferase [Achromobacter xylosoxidans]QNP85752.1 glycosyltransferase [Achromobacter xylosoxidans]RPJ89747.1 glycosyltransferase [Achromobacter xylosoxidans]